MLLGRSAARYEVKQKGSTAAGLNRMPIGSKIYRIQSLQGLGIRFETGYSATPNSTDAQVSPKGPTRNDCTINLDFLAHRLDGIVRVKAS
jgi:hypothetical protein